MKLKLLSCLLILLVGLPAMAAAPYGKSPQSTALTVDNEAFVAANNIYIFVTNHGNFGRDLAGVFGNDYGTYFPYTTDDDIEQGRTRSPYYAGGLWIGGVDSTTGDTLVVVSEYSSEYVPGPDSAGTFMADRPAFRVYKLYADSMANNPNADYLAWPVDQGAPVDEDGNPKLIGDHMAWSVFNDFNTEQHDNNNGETAPLGLKINQTVFAFERKSGSLANCVFIRYRIYNVGDKTLENCFFSLWSDPDLGTAGDDLVGCDTLLDLAFTYNETNGDGLYDGSLATLVVPAIGLDFFQGPLLPGNATDTARMWDTIWPGYTNMGLYSFNKYINGTDPDNYAETYAYMKGLLAKEPGYPPYVYGTDTLLFQASGDPVADDGDLDFAGDDRRHMQTTGPITFRPGDSTEVLAGMVVGQGGDYLSSITVMKAIDEFAQRVYENGFNPPKPPAKPVVTVGQVENRITLTWTDTSEIDQGDYWFEGYTVWQGASQAGPWIELATYDLDNYRNGALVDTLTDRYSGLPFPTPVRALTNSGMSRHYVANSDRVNGGRLNNLTDYYFKVSAFSWAERIEVDETDPDNPDTTWFYEDTAGNYIPPGDRLGESQTVLVVTPQAPPAGVNPTVMAVDTLPVTHTAGISDGRIWPIVMDPRATTGDTYQITFENAGGGVYPWTLVNLTTDDTLLVDQLNQTGDEDYYAFDGVLIKVLGPSPGVADWDIPQGTRRFTWASADFGFEGFNGAIGWADPESYFNGNDYNVSFLDLPEVELRLATVDVDGNFNVADSNVSYAYRYLRNAQNPPADPSFAPFIIDPSATYQFQAFEQSCPLSAWNMDVDPPQRLAVGYMENNVTLGLVDGKYWPPESDWLAANLITNAGSTGPREWLWIYLDDYSETADPAYTGNALNDPMPIMYWLTVARRGSDVPFSPGGSGQDVFTIIPARVNTEVDVFTFTTPLPVMTSDESDLDAITVVPNPFYLRGPYDPAAGNYMVRWHHLPQTCTITIYNLAGDFIRKIEKDDTTPIATWNLQTENRIPVASGIYIYVVDAPGFGQKIGKMAVFYEQETLQNY